jgi:hypothetical protein
MSLHWPLAVVTSNGLEGKDSCGTITLSAKQLSFHISYDEDSFE